MQENNPKRIRIYSISDEEINSSGDPIDAFGTPIRIEKNLDRILFRSAGPNRTFESGNKSDDIEVVFKMT